MRYCLYFLLQICFMLSQGQVSRQWVLVPAGIYKLGMFGNDINPQHTVKLAAFYISNIELTNAEFEKFINATGYVTDAERKHDAKVFEPGLKEFKWLIDTTAYWRYPNGKSRGGIENKMNHPVTSISYADIMKYCEWAGVRLPTLDEWEAASRCHKTNTIYFWGNEHKLVGKYGNIWHGRNHLAADSSDGYMLTSPAASFEPNCKGMYDMYGNVFEFCTGRLKSERQKSIAYSRGGSWWCSAWACGYYNSVDIGRTNIHASFSNQGFRVVKK